MNVREALAGSVAAFAPHVLVVLVQQEEGVLATLVRIQTVARRLSRDQSTGPTSCPQHDN